MGFKIPESVLIIIHHSIQQILLLKRTDNGLWQSVTGSRQHNEAIVETAVRELREETGLTADLGILTNTGRTHTYAIVDPWRPRYAPDVTHNTEFVFHFALYDLASAKIRINPSEHSEYQWVPAERAAELAFSATNRREIEALILD